ncbi:MFS transporter [Tropicibacter sp. R16_0]|uniref:MFS transporter n=1 Tax=Tropicibacter sp. R16_0 TaxID=2821102 RepID=UPI001AD96634|nr:MFS transporter [Tropicibacter sp. R16_0]MBO9452855.1 MFS transporter [Tropicibacter sp. R16_0]
MKRDTAVLLLALGQTLVWASLYYIFPALLLRWESDLGWSKADLTAAITIAVLVSAAASPLAGRIIDHGKGALMLGLSSLIGGVGLILLSGVTEKWQFFAVWVLIGLATSGCLYEPCFALITRARGAKAKTGIILVTLVAGFASTISYPAVYTLAEALGWRGAVQVFAALVIFVVSPILWLGGHLLERDNRTERAAPEPKQHSRQFLKTPAFWYLALGFACLAMAHGAALQHLLPILDERGLSPEMAVLAASFIGPMQVAGRIAIMASERYLSNHGVAMAAFLAMTLSMVMLLVSGTSPGFLSGFVILFGSAYGTVSILRPLLAREILGEANFGAKSGALALPYLAGAAMAPYLGSLIWTLGGYDLMLLVLLGVITLGAALHLKAHRFKSTV